MSQSYQIIHIHSVAKQNNQAKYLSTNKTWASHSRKI